MPKALEWKQQKLYLVDQSQLPYKTVKVLCRTPLRLIEALKLHQISGPMAEGLAAAFGVVLAIKAPPQAKTFEQLMHQIDKIADHFKKIRPLSVNVGWALSRMRRIALNHRDRKLASLKEILLKEAQTMLREDEKSVQAIAQTGADLLRAGDTVLTYGYTGGFSATGSGTALGMILEAAKRLEGINVLVCETRPRWQGAALTAMELKQAKVPFRLISDNMAAHCMKTGLVNVVAVGAERVAMNGDTAAVIGTYGLAMLTYHHNLPFYLVVPAASVDRQLLSGENLPLEEGPAQDLIQCHGKPLTVPGVKVYHPSCDITPHKYISAIVTELGIVRAPYDQSLRDLLATLV